MPSIPRSFFSFALTAFAFGCSSVSLPVDSEWIADGGNVADAHTVTDAAAVMTPPEKIPTAPANVGVIFLAIPGNPPTLHCTGTLIAPNKVLTAKHCVLRLKADATLTFGLGNRSDNTTPPVRVSEADVLYRDGQSGTRGSDVAVFTLESAIPDVVPAAWKSLPPGKTGEGFTFAGFGDPPASRAADGHVLDPVAREAPRPLHVVPVTVEMLEGNAFDRIYGNFDNFSTHASEAFPGLGAAGFRDTYETGRLASGYEAFANSGEGRTCYGDSGGPLRDSDGNVVGVVSAGLDAGCKLGDIFAIFGPDAFALIKEALSRTGDVCAGEPEAGRCASDVAIGCDTRRGPRHVVKLDCAASGRHCAVVPAGNVDCVR